MLKLIGILLLSGQLSVAVQGPNGYQERMFSCGVASMDPLFDFILDALGPGGPAIQFVVAPIELQQSCPSLFEALAKNRIGNAALSGEELQAFSRPGQEHTGRVVAEAFRAKHARVFRR